MEGQVIHGRYRIADLLGRGGMADVYEALDLQTGDTVALKILRLEAHKGVRRLRREAQHLRALEHPHIVRLLDVQPGHAPPYCVLQMVRGRPLDRWWSECQPKIVVRLLNVLDDVQSALAHAHTQGRIHRDIKPGNILVDANDSAMLLDFGLASLLDETRLTTANVIGTLRYIAPEQSAGALGDFRSDLYALGVMLYHLLTGHWPYLERTPYQYLERQRNATPKALSEWTPGLPAWLEREVLRLLEADPLKRHGSVQELQEALQRGRQLEWRTPGWSLPGKPRFASVDSAPVRLSAPPRPERDVDLWVNADTQEVWERARGMVDFGHRTILSRLLLHLMGAERTFKAAKLMQEVWGVRRVMPSDEHTVRVSISRLRKLLGADYILKTPPRYGQGGGYYFNRNVRYRFIRNSPDSNNPAG